MHDIEIIGIVSCNGGRITVQKVVLTVMPPDDPTADVPIIVNDKS